MNISGWILSLKSGIPSSKGHGMTDFGDKTNLNVFGGEK